VKVVAVLSSRYSGSTILDYMLGSHPKALSLTELRAFIVGGRTPFTCKTCHPPDSCPVWTADLRRQLLQNGVDKGLYELIASKSGYEILIDSSKQVAGWFSATLSGLDPDDVLCIHISKSPEEYAGSERSKLHVSKRHKIADIAGSWWQINSRILDFMAAAPYKSVSIRYRDLVDHSEELLTRLLQKLDQEYVAGMEYFWNFQHHPLWGNKGARSHFQDSDSHPKEWTDETVYNQELYSSRHRTLFRDEKWRHFLSQEEVLALYGYGRVARLANLLGYANPYTTEGQRLNDPQLPLATHAPAGSEAWRKEQWRRKIDVRTWHPVDFIRRQVRNY